MLFVTAIMQKIFSFCKCVCQKKREAVVLLQTEAVRSNCCRHQKKVRFLNCSEEEGRYLFKRGCPPRFPKESRKADAINDIQLLSVEFDGVSSNVCPLCMQVRIDGFDAIDHQFDSLGAGLADKFFHFLFLIKENNVLIQK